MATPDLPDGVTRRALLGYTAVAPVLLRHAPAFAEQTVTRSPEAWTAFCHGRAWYTQYTRTANSHAREALEQALRHDPTCVQAHALLAAVHRQDGNLAWSADRDQSEATATAYAREAVQLARSSRATPDALPYALAQWGWVLLYIQHEHAAALRAAREAQDVDATFAEGYALEAHIQSYWGHPEASLRACALAIAHHPTPYPFNYDYYRGHAFHVAGYLADVAGDREAARLAYDDAALHIRSALATNAQHRPTRSYLAVVLWRLGAHDEAAAHSQHLLAHGRLPATDPGFPAYLRRSLPYTDARVLEHLRQVWQAVEAWQADGRG